MSAKEVLMGAAGAVDNRPLPTFVSSSRRRETAGATLSLAVPTGVQDGDLLVALIYSGNGLFPTAPTGWALIYNDQSGANYVSIWTKIAASEVSAYEFSISSGGVGFALAYRNATSVNTQSSINRSSSSTSTATALSITPTYRGALVAAFSTTQTSAVVTTPPTGMALLAAPPTGPGGLSLAAALYGLSTQEAVATGNKVAVWDGSATTGGILLQITNEPSVAPEFISSATRQNTASSASLVINKPAGTVAGDLMMAFVSTDSASASRTWTGDTGWTEVADQNGAPGVRVAYKVATASEASSYTFTCSASLNLLSGCILTYRNASYNSVGSFAATASTFALPQVSSSASQSLLIAMASRSVSSLTMSASLGLIQRVIDNDSSSPSYGVWDQQAPAGPSGTRWVSTGSTTNAASGLLLSIKPTRSL